MKNILIAISFLLLGAAGLVSAGLEYEAKVRAQVTGTQLPFNPIADFDITKISIGLLSIGFAWSVFALISLCGGNGDKA